MQSLLSEQVSFLRCVLADKLRTIAFGFEWVSMLFRAACLLILTRLIHLLPR